MVNFDFQGESNLLSEKQINFVCDVLKKQGFEGSKVIIATLGNAGDNYSSSVKTITAKREDGKTLKMVAKLAPTSEFVRSATNVEVGFRNEFLMYDKILPKFRQLEIEANIPEEDRFKFPICYGMFNETLHEIILLEDLRESDYVMKDRCQSLTDDEIRIILDLFAKLHSFSFVLREKDLAAYKDLTSKLSDCLTSSQTDEHMNTANLAIVEENITSLFNVDRYKNKIRDCLSSITNEAHKLRRCDTGSKYSVIIHGDMWTNNILFKLDNNGIPEDCMLIDYQLSTEKNPVSDFLFLIFCCTDFDTRSKYYDSWIDEYHKKLDKYLSHYGVKANYVYSKEKMLADLKMYSKLHVGRSIMMANALYIDPEAIARYKSAMENPDKFEEIIETMKTDGSIDSKSQNLLKTKVQGIIDSYYDLGYCSSIERAS